MLQVVRRYSKRSREQALSARGMTQHGRNSKPVSSGGLAQGARLSHPTQTSKAPMSRAAKANSIVHARPSQQTQARSVAELQREIRSHGMRSTGPRVAVLGHLSRAAAPLSHTEIYEALAGDGFDRATIYRNLMDLAEVGLLVRSDLGDHVWRFERKQARSDHAAGHPHFVCVDCGGVSCLPDVAVKVVAASGAPKALATRQVEVQVKGRCDDCA
jgi:Fur family ferric uptake transcriptional regulator